CRLGPALPASLSGLAGGGLAGGAVRCRRPDAGGPPPFCYRIHLCDVEKIKIHRRQLEVGSVVLFAAPWPSPFAPGAGVFGRRVFFLRRPAPADTVRRTADLSVVPVTPLSASRRHLSGLRRPFCYLIHLHAVKKSKIAWRLRVKVHFAGIANGCQCCSRSAA